MQKRKLAAFSAKVNLSTETNFDSLPRLEYIPIPVNEFVKFGGGVASGRQLTRNVA